MTTLHCVVMISELSAGFNFTAAWFINCLNMHKIAHKMHYSKKMKKNFLRGGTPPDPSPIREGDTPSHKPTPRRLRRLHPRAFDARPAPQFRNLPPLTQFWLWAWWVSD